MRCIIGRDHRECIERRLFAGCRVLEWGSGGSTVWLADRLPAGAHLTSVEHHAEWFAKVGERLGERPNVTRVLAEPTGELGRNATIDEEDATHLAGYVGAADGQTFDVILVDGVARVACMERARELLNPGGVVFLHDAQRDWYDAGKALLVEHGTIGSCEDYAGPMLWWGGMEPERAHGSAAGVPVVVSFYTKGTPYEDEVAGLRESCERLGLDHQITGVEPAGSWERNCAMKAAFIRAEADRMDRPVLWVDADAVVRRPPVVLAGAEMDFAVHKSHGWQFGSGTCYFNRTPLARMVLDRWAELCESRPEIWDQIHLDAAWEMVSARHPLRTCWLPASYTKIFDLEAAHADEPVIEHFQASRRFKEAVSPGVRRMLDPTDELKAARRACRPRRCWYNEGYGLADVDPSPDRWSVEVAA
ncbi:MAG: class I SAM-dependent methyltransferase [Planctomycetota bacterium]